MIWNLAVFVTSFELQIPYFLYQSPHAHWQSRPFWVRNAWQRPWWAIIVFSVRFLSAATAVGTLCRRRRRPCSRSSRRRRRWLTLPSSTASRQWSQTCTACWAPRAAASAFHLSGWSTEAPCARPTCILWGPPLRLLKSFNQSPRLETSYHLPSGQPLPPFYSKISILNFQILININF